MGFTGQLERSQLEGEELVDLSSVSDELDSDYNSPFGSKLAVASRLWLERFSTVPEDRKLEIIECIFKESAGVSIPLLILEYLREKNGVTFCDGLEAPSEIPIAGSELIERLSDVLFLEAKKRFWRRFFPVSLKDGDRLYRLAHALGPERTEKVLTPNQDDFDEEACFAIILMTMRSLSPSLRLDLFNESTVNEQVSLNVFENLLRFASSDFWHRFMKSVRIGESSNSDLKVALLHLEAGKGASYIKSNAANC